MTTFREYVRDNPWLLAFAIVLTAISGSIGIFILGPLGAALGVAIGLLSLFVPWRRRVQRIEDS